MALSASIKHRTPGRIRLQLVDRDLAADQLEDTLQTLRQSPSLRRVESNPLTRTILMEADNEEQLQAALADVVEAQVLNFKAATSQESAPQHPRVHLRQLMSQADQFLKEASDGRVDLRTTGALLLTGFGVKQMIAGRFLPAGFTLVIYALGILELSRESDPAKN